jgi:ABC-type lipoprotein export system ATPase subunit
MPNKPSPVGDVIDEVLAQFNGDAEQAIQAIRSRTKALRQKTQPLLSDGPVLVNIEGLVKRYRVGKERVTALDGVSLQIREGEFVAFTGASGSGKSTLLQLIGGLDRPNSGRVIVDGKDLTGLSDSKLSTFRNKTIGFVFQFFYLQPFLRLRDNLEVPAIFARVKPRARREPVAELARAVGLDDRLQHLPKELSGGQMQRAAIARALLNKPKLLLADEPTGNLDSKNSEAIIELFEHIRKEYGTTVVVVTHDPKIAARADREITLKDGVIL